MYLLKIATGAGWKSEIRRKVLQKKLRLCRSLLHVCKQDLLPCFETYLVNKSFLQYLSIALYVWNMNIWRCFLSASVSNLAGNLLLFFLLVGHEGKDGQGVWCKSLGGQLYNLKYYESSKVTWDLIFRQDGNYHWSFRYGYTRKTAPLYKQVLAKVRRNTTSSGDLIKGAST